MCYAIYIHKPQEENRKDDFLLTTKEGELSTDGINPLIFNSFLYALLCADKLFKNEPEIYSIIPFFKELEIKL